MAGGMAPHSYHGKRASPNSTQLYSMGPGARAQAGVVSMWQYECGGSSAERDGEGRLGDASAALFMVFHGVL